MMSVLLAKYVWLLWLAIYNNIPFHSTDFYTLDNKDSSLSSQLGTVLLK